MKIYIKSSSDANKYMLDTLQMYLDIAISEKHDTFEKMLDITYNLTGDDAWSGHVYTCKQGMWFKLEGTRSSFQAYVDSNGRLVRKPRNLIFNRRFCLYGRKENIDRYRLEESCDSGVKIL